MIRSPFLRNSALNGHSTNYYAQFLFKDCAFSYREHMQRRKRLSEIVSAVMEQRDVDVPSLATMFEVSEATIRRDLALLEEQRLVSRTRGGATPNAAFNDVPLSLKHVQNAAEKEKIAERAAQYLQSARVIGMTGGTTLAAFAAQVVQRDGLTVVTNAVNIASTLLSNPHIRVLVAGGEARNSSQETVGPVAEAFLGDYNLDVAFLGVDGVHPQAGCTNYDPIGARVNKVLVERASRTIVLVDATKISRVALAPVCAMTDVDVLITDARADVQVLDEIRTLGCEVVCAS